VEQTCSRTIIIAGGRIVASGSPQELRDQLSAKARVVAELRGPAAEIEKGARALEGVEGFCKGRMEKEITIRKSDATLVPVPLQASLKNLGNPLALVLAGKDLPIRSRGGHHQGRPAWCMGRDKTGRQ
jgi:ABC-type multidrug transport system ATPase subunit